jgi:steroid delta-isomerase-like uncharacterized protein
MTREEIVAMCRRQADAWNAHDEAAVAAFFAEDATLYDAGGETSRGREGIAARAKRYMDAFPDMRLEVTSVEVDGNRFTMEWRASGTNSGSLAGMPATNKPAVVEGCDVGEVREDGLIERETDYWNEASLMRQLGMMPEPAATA